MTEDTRYQQRFKAAARYFGAAGLFGGVVFVLSLIFLHWVNSDFDWLQNYVSDYATQKLSWLFLSSTFIHGVGNIALATGLHFALTPGRYLNWSTLLFGLAGVGIVLTAFFTTDPPGQSLSAIGLTHRLLAGSSFVLELVALFLFAVAFERRPRWRRYRSFYLPVSWCAVITLVAFGFAIITQKFPGLAERAVVAILLLWEIWASFELTSPRQSAIRTSIPPQTTKP